MENNKITISVRDIPEEIWWQAKATAATRKMSIRSFIISLLEQAVKEEE